MTKGSLVTGALTCGTAATVMLALPSWRPVTDPVCETRSLVLSEENQTNVKPVVTRRFPASAIAVSCSVPLSPTVESPVITTELSEEGPGSLPHPAIVSATPSSRHTRFMRSPRESPYDDPGIMVSLSGRRAGAAASRGCGKDSPRPLDQRTDTWTEDRNPFVVGGGGLQRTERELGL